MASANRGDSRLGSGPSAPVEPDRLAPEPRSGRGQKGYPVAELASGMTPPPLVIRGILAGVVAALTFRHAALLVLSIPDLVPAPSLSLKPAPQLAIPAVALLALWGTILALLLAQFRRDRSYWRMAFLYGAVLLTAPSVAIVLATEGWPALGSAWPQLLAALVANGAWGVGTALFLVIL
jgi:hypothetical protein